MTAPMRVVNYEDVARAEGREVLDDRPHGELERAKVRSLVTMTVTDHTAVCSEKSYRVVVAFSDRGVVSDALDHRAPLGAYGAEGVSQHLEGDRVKSALNVCLGRNHLY